MTREEQLNFCRVCKHKKMDLQRGIICGLTDEYAAFERVCKDYMPDDRTSRKVNEQPESAETYTPIEEQVRRVFVLVIVVGVVVAGISAMVVNVWKYGSAFIQALAILLLCSILVLLAISLWRKKKVKDNKLSIEKVMDCIRKEGYYPQKREDGSIFFKIQGQVYEVFYQDSFFVLIFRFGLDEEQVPFAEKAASMVMGTMKLIIVSTTVLDDKSKVLNFAIEQMISSAREFENYFPLYMRILLESIERHRELYYQCVEESNKTEYKVPKIGFN